MSLIGVGLVLLLAAGAAVLLTRDDEPVSIPHPGQDALGDGDVAGSGTPAFRFTRSTRELVRTSPGRIKQRKREASARVAASVREVLTDLYTEGFLDPANWKQGRYTDAFGGFTAGARKQAEARPGLLTAGLRAGDRYEQILPVSGRLVTRILLDRTGSPTLVVSMVRFSAEALGPEPVTLRSRGQFFFERLRGRWKIVSFHVTRTDTPLESA
jgi:hypothetical protein